jgi:hypothetical protein
MRSAIKSSMAGQIIGLPYSQGGSAQKNFSFLHDLHIPVALVGGKFTSVPSLAPGWRNRWPLDEKRRLEGRGYANV